MSTTPILAIAPLKDVDIAAVMHGRAPSSLHKARYSSMPTSWKS